MHSSNPNEHLEMSELARLLEAARTSSAGNLNASEVHAHFAVCKECREQFESLADLDNRLNNAHQPAATTPKDDCPQAVVWDQIAAGLTTSDETLSYLDHASRCDHCGPKLRSAVGEVGDLNRELTDAERRQIRSLASAQPEWQLKLAERISGRTHPAEISGWKRWLSIPSLAAVSVAILLIAGLGWWAIAGRTDAASANKLLARAYTDQRTLELRVPGAAFAPLRVQRGPAESFVARPAPLLKAEALIANQLAAHPDDPAWLQAAARADVLEGKYDAAVESLQRAVELQPHSPELLFDLGTAHFQRGQSEDRQEDYGAAYEDLSEVLAAEPDNAPALFNRAIVAEHQFLYQQALDDWEHYLKLDSTSQWADEARSRAEAVRAKLKEHEGQAMPLLAPKQVANSDGAVVDERVEEYLDAAVRTWLPFAYPESAVAGDPQAKQALFFLANLTSQKHADHWLSDLLSGASAPMFPRAVAALARASLANSSGGYTTGLEQAQIADRLFRASNNGAGVVRARFEEAYAEQLTRKTDDCRAHAISALTDADRQPYGWLQVQLRLEKAVCSLFEKDDWGGDERISREAMERARASKYDGLGIRALYFVAEDETANGDLESGLKLTDKALRLYWSHQLSPLRAINIYDLLGRVPEFTSDRPHLVVAIWREATALANSTNNVVVQASTHSNAARAALSIREPEVARHEYAEAARLYALAPRSYAVQNAVMWNEIHAAAGETNLGEFDAGIARLTRIQDQVVHDPEKYAEEEFYTTLGELELRSQHPALAEQAFRPALESTERRLVSLNSETERINWSQEAAPVYLGMVEAELAQGRTEESLEYFEWYLGAPGRSGKSSRGSGVPDSTWLSSRLPLLSDKTVLAFAALPDGLAIWCYDNRGVNAQWFPQSNQNLRELAGRFYDLASDPNSERLALRRDGQSLYDALITPIESRLEPGRTLVIEADGWLARVPFEALIDHHGHYLIERAPIVHSLGQNADASLHEEVPISASLHALILASTAAPQDVGLVPLPDVAAEADAVGRDFHSSAVLKASEATVQAVEQDLASAEVFHFTGHSLAGQNGAALLLESTNSESASSGLLTADKLRSLNPRNLQLAVLSTCYTGSGRDGSRGFNNIAAALQRAGVPHVVASRWAVDSVETRRFVEGFYRNALSGEPVSEAIRETSRSMMADARTSHPYYWSAFSAYGRP